MAILFCQWHAIGANSNVEIRVTVFMDTVIVKCYRLHSIWNEDVESMIFFHFRILFECSTLKMFHSQCKWHCSERSDKHVYVSADTGHRDQEQMRACCSHPNRCEWHRKNANGTKNRVNSKHSRIEESLSFWMCSKRFGFDFENFFRRIEPNDAIITYDWMVLWFDLKAYKIRNHFILMIFTSLKKWRNGRVDCNFAKDKSEKFRKETTFFENIENHEKYKIHCRRMWLDCFWKFSFFQFTFDGKLQILCANFKSLNILSTFHLVLFIKQSQCIPHFTEPTINLSYHICEKKLSQSIIVGVICKCITDYMTFVYSISSLQKSFAIF